MRKNLLLLKEENGTENSGSLQVPGRLLIS